MKLTLASTMYGHPLRTAGSTAVLAQDGPLMSAVRRVNEPLVRSHRSRMTA
jgi:hypothetical protein